MKYLRKIVALLIGVVFLTAVVISLGMIFAVKNINVTLITYADDSSENYIEAKNSLSVFKGESILFVNERDVERIVADSNFSLAVFEKKFPCTVNVTLKERLETFVVSVGGVYSFYDNDGKFLRKSTDNVNINDGSPNVEITGVAPDEIGIIANVASMFKDSFKALRSIVTSINLDANSVIEGYTDKLVFNMRSGLKIRLDDYLQDTEEKISAAYAEFITLTDRQKLGGTVRSYRIGGADGVVNADYSMF